MGNDASTEGTTAELIRPGQRRRPRRAHRPVIDREGEALRRTLRVFDRLRQLAAEEGRPKKAAELEDLAWQSVGEAEPIRVLHACQLLRVTDQTVREWMRRGLIEDRGENPRRVGLESVLRVKAIVDELRELGQDRDLVGAALSKLEAEEVAKNERFQRSLEQMRRGERGEWPQGW